MTVDPFRIDESVPDEEDIEWSVKQLQSNGFRGTLEMWEENLRRCLEEAREAEEATKTGTEIETEMEPPNPSN